MIYNRFNDSCCATVNLGRTTNKSENSNTTGRTEITYLSVGPTLSFGNFDFR